MDFIEQATPRGITLKVFPKKWEYLAFDKKGKSIYSDTAGLKVMHRIQMVVFVGETFTVKNNAGAEMSFLKATRGQIVIPYVDSAADRRQNYIFVPTESGIDLIPVRVKALKNISTLVREIETGNKPDHIVVSALVTRNDIIIIKNRLANAHIILVGGKTEDGAAPREEKNISSYEDRRATEVAEEVNINMMSNNPVFLARVHLREMNISKVNQLILDFELSQLELEYILGFISIMLSKSDKDDNIRKNVPKLKSIQDSLQFYIHLLAKNEEGIGAMIGAMEDAGLLASFFTLIAKVKLLYPGTDDQLLFTEFENMLYEKKSSLEGMA